MSAAIPPAPVRSSMAAKKLARSEAKEAGWRQVGSRLLCTTCRTGVRYRDPRLVGLFDSLSRTTDSGTEPASWEDQTEVALCTLVGADVADEMTGSEAYGALVYRLRQQCEKTGASPAEVLATLEDDVLGFVERADNPAAFLAAKVRDL